MISESMGMIILKTGNKSQQYFCECGKCQYNKIDYVYSWLQVKDLGWSFERSDTDSDGRKLSGINPNLEDDAGHPITLYCPKCKEGNNVN